MTYWIGNGLPSTLTAARIKSVLGLAKSHERTLKAALDASASPPWTATASDDDLYERLRDLLATTEGRAVYEAARSDFEGAKPKLSGRADLLGRLLDDCRKEAFGRSDRRFSQDLNAEFIENSNWPRLAEVVWAESLMFGNAEYFLDAITDHPEIRPHLEDVENGLLQIEDDEDAPVPEEDGEAADLVGDIRRVAENLDADRLDEQELLKLCIDAGRLAEISRSRTIRDRDMSLLRVQVEDWEERHREGISDVETVADALAALKVCIGEGRMDREDVGAALDLVERLLSAETRYRETHRRLIRASQEADLASVDSLNEALKALSEERDEARDAIDSAFARPQPSDTAQQMPPEDDEEPCESETTDHGAANETDPDELQPSDREREPVAALLAEDAPDPDAEKDPPPAAEGRNGEPSTEPMGETVPSDEDEEGSARQVENAIAMAIERGRFGLAYHLARAVTDALPSANTVKLVACNYVTDKRAPIGAELSDLAGALLSEANTAVDNKIDHPRPRDDTILATCAALAPALQAPGGLIFELLLALEPRLGDMTSLRALAKAAAEVSMKGVDLPFALLREDDTLDKWRDRESALRTETTSWLANERKSKIRFHAATRVWRRMLDDWEGGGRASLGHIFALLDNPTQEIDEKRVSEIVEYWRTNSDKEIDRIDREKRNTASKNKIEGPARLDLRNKIDEALIFSDRWLSVIRERPDRRPAFSSEQAKILRTAVDVNAERALSEIDRIATPLARGAGALLRRYMSLFTGTEGKEGEHIVSLTDLLHGELFADPNIEFDDTREPSEVSLDTGILLPLLKQDTPDFRQAAVERARSGDFHGAELTLDFAERTGRIDEQGADRAYAEIERERSLTQGRLKEKIRETKDRLDAAYAEGALALETYEEQNDRIPNIDFSEIATYAPLFSRLSQIDEEINTAKEGRREAIRGSLNDLPKLSSDERERIELALDSGLLQVAEDLRERIGRGEELPPRETEVDRAFDQFFPHFAEKYTTFGEKGEDGIAHVRHMIQNRGSSDFIDASGLSEDASKDGIRVLDAWATLHDNQTSPSSLSTLARALGFRDVKVSGSSVRTSDGERIFSLRAAPVADRRIARLPDFGSRAAGKYRLFAIRGRTTGEAVFREAGRRNGVGGSPDIVLFLGVLDADSRRSLVREFGSGDYHPSLVLDEALVAFLATWPSDRLGAFFDCASAFAFSQPFDPDAAELPPEMFFGRADARRKILAMSGDVAHFVYGGRRMGKTALLADIAREYRMKEREEPEKLVLLINLKGTGVGENRPTEELWRLFAERLAEHGVLRRQTVRPDSIEKSIGQWLKEKEDRRILLLVDEADAFLDAERLPSQNYRVLAQVKGLMEETERKFKVVFAGLHNVQRAARDPNTPFAHLGEAIRIGPMLPEDDGDEIQNLIRSPLEALGYRFDSNDSVIRIAAETNYYPALAQQFCKELLKTLRADVVVRGEAGPPYSIHPDMVDRVFNAPETRDRILNLFSWTIQLDPRYGFLTYLIARKSFDNEDARPHAVTIADIREEALTEWPKGFSSDPSFWMFEVLLEEMVGLGILRESSHRQYAIRTRNLRVLLGNDEEIERRFADAKTKMAPAVFDPAQFRDTLNDGIPSSLAADQANRLLSGGSAVGVVFGTRLAGLDRVRESLERAAKRPDGPPLYMEEAAPTGLRAALSRVAGRRRPGTHVVLVDMCGAWDREAVDRALAFVAEHEGQNRIVRPVFLCGPEEAWKRLNEPLPTRGRAELREVWLDPCARDFVRIWLKDRESRAYVSMENPDRPVDPPWPATAGTAARNKLFGSIDEAINAVLDDDADDRCVSDIRISAKAEAALRVLSDYSDGLTADDISILSGDAGEAMTPEEAVDFFDWADRLGVVRRDGHGYRLDSTYAAGLGRVFDG